MGFSKKAAVVRKDYRRVVDHERKWHQRLGSRDVIQGQGARDLQRLEADVVKWRRMMMSWRPGSSEQVIGHRRWKRAQDKLFAALSADRVLVLHTPAVRRAPSRHTQRVKALREQEAD